MKTWICALALPVVLASNGVHGETSPPTSRFTLDGYLRAVASENLELAAQRASVSIAQAQVAIAKVFPDPQITGGLLQYDVSRHGDGDGEASATATVVQVGVPIQLGGKRGARVAVAEGGVSTAEAELEDFLRTLRASGANLYVDALHSKLVLERKQQTLASLERLIKVNEQRLKAGDIGEVQLVQSRVEGQQFRAEVLAADGNVQTANLALVQLLGTAATSQMRQTLQLAGDLRTAADRSFDLEPLVAFALSHRPDLLSAHRRVSLARKQIDLAQANRVIDITLGGTWQHNFSTSGVVPLPTSDFIGGTLTVPLPLSRIYRGDLDAARAAKDQSQTLATAAEIRIEVEVRQAVAQYDKAAGRVKLYTQGTLSDADRVLEKTLYNYQHGGATLVEVLVAQRTVDAVYLAYYDALADSAHALVAVERATAMWDLGL
jgi:cobalt-zinc-cadmium efflux system outer membrane protein